MLYVTVIMQQDEAVSEGDVRKFMLFILLNSLNDSLADSLNDCNVIIHFVEFVKGFI